MLIKLKFLFALGITEGIFFFSVYFTRNTTANETFKGSVSCFSLKVTELRAFLMAVDGINPKLKSA